MPGTVNTTQLDSDCGPQIKLDARARRRAPRAEQFLRLRRQQLRRWSSARESPHERDTRDRRPPCISKARPSGRRRCRAGTSPARCFAARRSRPIRRPSGPRRRCWRRPSAGARRTPWRWRSKWRPRRWPRRAATPRTCPASSLRRMATWASTTTCAARWRTTPSCCRRSSSTTRCTTPPWATGPSAPAAWRRAIRSRPTKAASPPACSKARRNARPTGRPVLLVGFDMPAVGALAR